ncbi:VanZ family protein [Pseudoteredinibacter isoporae]|uniref:VanZ family protein n=1 Tax=Pseudoteredinibacter isoporae TaxID=570281 RepID=A0A7X0MXW0_9GAMM|nr:VanZ family protein [Pseudoteredinibacter isoporae]MBB6522409.1 VanZ family protein [Pseudoteredinibacter isoporae]NHO87942.1 VanZ family protein [Pseudoteredinibacter isoporae]NIB23727.1 VanZ family protein [Pseudoteredinibacter isoporae]
MLFWTQPHSSPLLRNSRHLRWGLFIALLAIALFFNLSPSPGKGFSLIWDKALHFICWGTVAGAFGLAAYPYKPRLPSFTVLLLIASAAETGQLWVPGRLFDWGDILANALGLIAAFLFWLAILSFRNKQHPDTSFS